MKFSELIELIYRFGYEVELSQLNTINAYLIIKESDHEIASVSLDLVGSFSLLPESPSIIDKAVIEFSQTPLKDR